MGLGKGLALSAIVGLTESRNTARRLHSAWNCAAFSGPGRSRGHLGKVLTVLRPIARRSPKRALVRNAHTSEFYKYAPVVAR